MVLGGKFRAFARGGCDPAPVTALMQLPPKMIQRRRVLTHH
jgi:hypothetical protein